MPAKRITMAEVARAAGVHQTTVSLALRNDPRLPRATRQRLRALAERLGYRPDPMLSALNFYRSSRDAARPPPTMAFVMRSRADHPPEHFFTDEQFYRGARRAADRLGYRLVGFQIGHAPSEGARLSRILRSRGIDGVIIGPLDVGLRELAMDWDCFSALCIESQHLGLSLHTVANHQTGGTRTAVRRLFELGYERVGLAVGALEEASIGQAFTTGYLIAIHEHADRTLIPPLLLHSDSEAATAARIGAWIRRHRIDGLLSNWSNILDLLKTAGLRVPRDIGVATLDVHPHRGAVAGIDQCHELVGERAVEALALLMKTNQRGLIRQPNTTLIDGLWQDGPELPPRGPVHSGGPRARSA
jgi:LacI family transcriptional regulator